MNTETFLILLLIGSAAGILAGMFGIGGGIIIVPSLLSIYSYNNYQSNYIVHVAIATSLFTIIFTTLSSGYKHSINKNINWKAAVLIGIASSVSVFLFSKIATGIPGELLKKIFSVILILIAIRLFFQKKESGENENLGNQVKINSALCIFIGILSGIIAAFSGLGGGIFVIPMMYYFLKIPIKKSIGTSSAAILVTALTGVLGYSFNAPQDFTGGKYFLGMVDTYSALPIVIASIPLSQLGVYIHNRTKTSVLTRLFAVFILLVSVRMLFF